MSCTCLFFIFQLSALSALEILLSNCFFGIMPVSALNKLRHSSLVSSNKKSEIRIQSFTESVPNTAGHWFQDHCHPLNTKYFTVERIKHHQELAQQQHHRRWSNGPCYLRPEIYHAKDFWQEISLLKANNLRTWHPIRTGGMSLSLWQPKCFWESHLANFGFSTNFRGRRDF